MSQQRSDLASGAAQAAAEPSSTALQGPDAATEGDSAPTTAEDQQAPEHHDGQAPTADQSTEARAPAAPRSDAGGDTHLTGDDPTGTQPDPTTIDAAPQAPPPDTDAESPVEVIEQSVLEPRLRRPMDLVRMAVSLALVVLVVALLGVAASTSADIDEGLLSASRRLPDFLVLILNAIGGLGLLTLPVAASVDLLVRGRGRQLFDALLALFLSVLLLTVASLAVEQLAPDAFRVALAGSTSPDDDPFLPLFGGLVGFVTVARLMARPRWNVITSLVVTSLMLVSFITGGITIAGIVLSLLIGWFTGLLIRYVMGTPTTRPSGLLVAQTLLRAGFPVTTLQAVRSTQFGRRYLAYTAEGPNLHVVVLDRDLEGAGLVTAVWNKLRLRSSRKDSNVNMRRALDQRALMSYAATATGAPTPRLALASEVGPDSSLLAYDQVAGVRLNTIPPEEVTDDDLRQAFEALKLLQDARLAHRNLSAANLLRTGEGRIYLMGVRSGSVAASDVALRIDIAELLATAAMLAGPERALRIGQEVLGTDTLIRGLPVLQRVAMSPQNRKELRGHKGLLNQLRDGIIQMRPDAEMEQIQLERVRPKTLMTVILGTVAFYLLFSQLAQVDLVTLIRDADWALAVVALVCSILTYAAATWALSGFVPEKLPFFQTMQAQFAASFATLVTPPTLGAVAINLRYLQRKGVHPALATASIGAAQASAFVMHILMLLAFGVAAGTQSDLTFEPPRSAVIAVIAVIVLTLAMLSLPPIRNPILHRFGPMLRQIGPRLLTLVQQPRKMFEGIGGLLLLNLGYVAALVACVHAFGGSLPIAAIGVVYLTGSVVGQAAPTPGGLGAVEAALAAGLTAAGLNGGLAVSSVLLFRLVTFWLPTIPGWFALNSLQRKGML